MHSSPRPAVAIVLPHRERFEPGSAGAIASIVHRLVTNGSRYDAVVVGPRIGCAPFPGTSFVPVSAPGWLPLTPTQSYALVVARALARLPPCPVEVYNKPDVAALLARLFPHRPVSLFLQNDPRTMRGARTAAARRRLLLRLARVVVASDYLRCAMLDGVTVAAEREPVVMHNTIAAAEIPAPTPMAEREPVLLFAGRVVAEKAPDAFIAACSIALPQLPGWRAEVIGAAGFAAGAPDSAFIHSLRGAATLAGVAMRGFMPQAAVLQEMARACVVVVPSRWAEPFGLVALEAMACGAALACSGRGGLSEVMGECALAIDPDDVEGFARALVRLGSDPTLRTRLAEAGVQRARDRFDVGLSIGQLDAMRDAIVAAV